MSVLSSKFTGAYGKLSIEEVKREMSTHTEHQIITKNDVPLFVVVPYAEYIAGVQRAKKAEEKVYFPQEVVEKSAIAMKTACFMEK